MNDDIRSQLLRSIRDCTRRGLLISSKWSAELLSALPPRGASGVASHRKLFSTEGVAAEVPTVESDSFILAKTYFDLKGWSPPFSYPSRSHHPLQSPLTSIQNGISEYQRAAYILECSNDSSHEAVFLKNYALYLSGEKQRHEELLELNGKSV
jgi:hypothetical protein